MGAIDTPPRFWATRANAHTKVTLARSADRRLPAYQRQTTTG